MEAPSDMSDGDISVTSTAPSDYQEEYEVEAVLAERDFEGILLYLVKWEGYPMERCTWEPEESFCDPQTLRDWNAKKEAIAQKKEQPFDVDALMERIEALDEAKALRQQKRKKKRRRLGIPVSPSDSSERSGDSPSLDGFIIEDDQIDENLTPRSKKRKRKEKRESMESQRTSAPSQTRQTSPGPKAGSDKSSSKPINRTVPRSDPNIPTKKSRPTLTLTTDPSTFASGPPPANRPGRITIPNSSNVATKAKPQARPTSSTPTIFRNLSTKRRHEKAIQRDRAPDISQLDLRTPNEWTKGQRTPGIMAPPPPPPPKSQTADLDSLFVEQDDPVSHETSPSLSRATSTGEAREKGPTRDGNRNPALDVAAKSVSTRDTLTTSSSRFQWKRRSWQRGEIMVHLKLSPIDKLVGDVRIQGLNPKSFEELIQLKSKNHVTLDFRHVCTLDEYAELCKSGFNMSFANAGVLGYEDTAPALNEMTDYLKTHDLAALWYHPNYEAQLVLVAYVYESPTWSFLHQDSSIYFPHGLRIVARGTLPPFDSLQSVENTPVTPRDTQPDYSNTQSVSFGLADVSDDTLSEPSLPPPTQPSVPQGKDPYPQVAEGGNLDVVTIFREKFNINYTELIPAKPKGGGSHRTCPFYLCFPEDSQEVDNELELFKRFLKHYDVPIFTSRSSDDWDRFVKIAESGTVVFHENFVFYERMPRLNHILQKPFKLFNISLCRPIENIDGQHLQPLFPRGGVILMSEDFMLREPASVLKILLWFRGLIKVSPGWKIYFRPNIQQWLFNLFDSWSDDSMYRIYCLVKDLIPDYPRGHVNYNKRSESPDSLDGLTDDEGQHHPIVSMSYIRSYGSRSENEHDEIPKGLSQQERDTDQLVEYFAGWSLMNCDKYRKFYVLTHFKAQPRWQKWHQLMIMNGDQFVKNLDDKRRKHSGKHSGSGSRSQAHPNSNPTTRQPSSEIPPPPPPSRSRATSSQQAISPATPQGPESPFSMDAV